jgi:phosphoribosylformylglycinamidine synthase
MIKPEIYHSLGLRDEDYQKILKILKREPTITELAMFSVEWSEHCSYSRSKKYLRFLPREGKYKVLVGEDAGGIVLDDLAVIFKMESHNHPSQIEPKQGAATGVGGIIRDIFTTGARPIALMDSLRFGPLTDSYNKFLLHGVVDGIQFYGNCLGVPTVGGEIYFESCYSGNCLVNVMSIGIAKRNKLARARATGVGNSILYVGASTGRDGIGGCSVLASQEFCNEVITSNEEKRPSVQIGDPFTEKCLIEATLEAINTGDIVGIKDMGAGGLTCATSEMAAAGGSGIEIELQNVPRREKGMESWEVMISESQERMLACVKKGKEKEIQNIFAKWDLNAVVIGKVTADRMVRVKDRGKVVAQIPADALANPPVYDLASKKPDYLDEIKKLDLDKISLPKNFNQVLLKLLSSPNIASKEWVYRQYDHMVQTNTVVLPGSDAAVLRLKENGRGTHLGGGTHLKGIAVTTDCNSRYCYLNPYRGAEIAVAEAMRNLVCVGAEPAGITDCLNFANPDKPDRYWQFKECIRGITDVCQFFQIPVVSGNVSFYNENPQDAIYPTPTIGMVGILPDINQRCNQYFKNEGDEIILLGICKEELGGSEYLKEIHSLVKGEIPELDLELEKSVQKTTLEVINQGLVNSAHDCSEGGLAVALAECCISRRSWSTDNREKKIGCKIDNLPSALKTDALLFGETQSRIVLSAKKSAVNKIKSIAQKNNTPLRIIGKTGGERLIIETDKRKVIDLPLDKLENSWRQD